ncbi:Fur family transcriptional regulator [Streptomyces sp. NPDC088757]|uniref:Fur family transcriptional regulator n=1 Tax=Streptomyces sp. NPDC088757 TaxID=3365889 RepID=UPI0037F2A226
MSSDTPPPSPCRADAPAGGRGASERRSEILEVLGETGRFLTARQLHVLIAARGHDTGLSTVYRTLRVADAAGRLEVVHDSSGKAYRLLPDTHQHRLECRGCGEGVPFVSEALEEWIEGLGSRYGFTDVRHAVNVTGTCTRCP